MQKVMWAAALAVALAAAACGGADTPSHPASEPAPAVAPEALDAGGEPEAPDAAADAGTPGAPDRAREARARVPAPAEPFPDASVDVVYAHGVLQYAADPAAIVAEAHRVLRPGGEAIFMVYNRISWLMALSVLMKVPLEHADAPGLTVYSIGEFRRMLSPFGEVRIVPERFPVRSRLHTGMKAVLYNGVFVGAFNVLPRALVRRYGWHLMGLCRKS